MLPKSFEVTSEEERDDSGPVETRYNDLETLTCNCSLKIHPSFEHTTKLHLLQRFMFVMVMLKQHVL